MARIVGTRNADTLSGTDMRDFLIGRAGNDSLSGLGGNDVLAGGSGSNTLDGGDGFDTADYADAAGPVYVNLFEGIGSAIDREDTLVSIERVVGSAFADTLAGSDRDETLDGGAGDDFIYASAGANNLIGGEGVDFAVFSFAQEGVTIDLRVVDPQANGFGGSDTLQGIEALSGSDFADVLIGDAGNNVFIGGGGDDTVEGGDGFDVLFYGSSAGNEGIVANMRRGVVTGGAGVDTFTGIERINGSVAADTFIGSGQANQFTGAGGADTFMLAKGQDTLIYRAASESSEEGGIDRITHLARKDVLNFSFLDADTISGGDQAFQIVSAFTGTAGELTVRYDATTNLTTVGGDIDGDGMADLTIFCDGNVTRFVDGWVL